MFVLRESGGYWAALCLENGLVGQGDTKEGAVEKLKEAIVSFEDVRRDEADIYSAPLSVSNEGRCCETAFNIMRGVVSTLDQNRQGIR